MLPGGGRPVDRLVRLSINLRMSARKLAEVTTGLACRLPELEILVLLDPERGARQMSARQLQRLLVLTSGALTHRLAKMEAAGRIRRIRTATDRRLVLIEITPAGVAELRRILLDQDQIGRELSRVEQDLPWALPEVADDASPVP